MTPKTIEEDVEIISVEYTFSLPDWVSDLKYDAYVPIHYDKGHAWAGSYSHSVRTNVVHDELDKLPLINEICIHPMSSWLKIEVASCGSSELQKVLKKFKRRLVLALTKIQNWEPPKEEEEEEDV